MKLSNNILIFCVITIGLVGGYVFSQQNIPTLETNQKPIIATTIPPLAAIAQEIAGETYTVLSILPAGASPHTFEVTPETIKKINQATIIFSVGANLDTWITEIAENTNAPIVSLEHVVELMSFDDHTDSNQHHDVISEEKIEADDHDHKGTDPHYWLSPKNAGLIALTIAGQLSATDPEHETIYQQNALNFIQQMNDLTEEIDGRLRSLPNKHLITFHESWNYFARDFDFEIVATFESSPGKEPTPKELAAIQTIANQYGIPALFSEPQLSPDVIRPFINDLGLKLAVLDPLGGVEGRMTYEDLIRYNARILYETYSNQSW